QGGARMIGSGGGHPQALGPPGGPQFPGQNEGPQGPQQGIYGETHAQTHLQTHTESHTDTHTHTHTLTLVPHDKDSVPISSFTPVWCCPFLLTLYNCTCYLSAAEIHIRGLVLMCV